MPTTIRSFSLACLTIAMCCWTAIAQDAAPPELAAEEPAQTDPAPLAEPAEPADPATPVAQAEEASPFGVPPGATPLTKDLPMWIDAKRKLVIMDGEICLREGQLEMFACLKGTKEHESIVSLNAKAFVAHAALMALGAEPGSPVKFDPVYAAATGPEIDVLLLWIDREGKKHTVRGQDWVRDVKTKKAMQYPWVFPGSGFWVDEMTGERHYLAEGGDFICVSNFPSAMLELPVESTQANQALMFEAFTEKIPPLGTKVRMVLRPKFEAKSKEGKSQATNDK
jgi:hypothetical protein